MTKRIKRIRKKASKESLQQIFDIQRHHCKEGGKKYRENRKSAREFFKKLKTDIEKGDIK